MPEQSQEFDLYTFISGAALESGKPFPVECNCGGVITIVPPFQDEFVDCARCDSTIRMLVLEGDPGYIISADPDGSPKLLPVQGSTACHPSALTPGERASILARAKNQFQKRE